MKSANRFIFYPETLRPPEINMIVFASFCPHPPLIIPSVGKENTAKLQETIKAYEYLEKIFYSAKPEAAVVISPHGAVYEDAVSINLCDRYFGGYEEFGDFATKREFKADYQLIDRLQRHMRRSGVSITLDTCEKLDHGTLIPLDMLTVHSKTVKIVPLTQSGEDFEAHYKFGLELKDFLIDTNKRVALIASGDLSHSLSTDSPAGYTENGQKFDDCLKGFIDKNDMRGIRNIDTRMAESANQCALKPLLVLAGALDGIDYKPEILSYESPFGVGYLTCHFKIK